MTDYVFAYGSLLDPQSLRGTLPAVDLQVAHGARLHGYTRRFDVAFPNDGSQGDKAYFDAHGDRPPFVLFANVVPAAMAMAERPVNGARVRVTRAELSRLVQRERRYRLVDVTADVEVRLATGAAASGPDRTWVFVGRAEFTSPQAVSAAVASREYLATIDAGVAYWEARQPGFRQGFRASTTWPARVVDLRRV